MNRYAADPEPLVLTSLLDALDGVKNAFVPPEVEADFAAYVRRTLGPALARIGLERKPGEEETVSLLRPRLIEWVGDRGRDEAVEGFARERAAAYLANPSSVDPAVVSTAIRIAAHRGDRALFEEYRRHFETARIPVDRARFLAALGSFRDPALREDALAYALTGPLRPNELFDFGWGMGDTPEGQERLFRWMTENYDPIVARLPQEFAGFMPYLASGCSQDRLEAARVFFAPPEHRVPGTEKQLAKVEDQVHDCVTLREREGEAVARYLRESARNP